MGTMGLWPFGREPADVESASRVVTAATRDSLRVRAKLTLHFSEPQTQSAADAAADRCALLAEALFCEVLVAEELLGNEDELSVALAQRLPFDLPPARNVELAAIHVVGAPGSTVRRRNSSSGPAPGSSDTPPQGASAPPGSPLYPPQGASATPGSPLYPPGSPLYPPQGGSYLPGSTPKPPQSSALHAAGGAPHVTPQGGHQGPMGQPPGPMALYPPPPSSRYPPPGAPYTPPPSSRYPSPGVGYTAGGSYFPPAGAPYSPPSTRPPPSSVAGRRRSTSSSIRAISASIVPPRGSPPAEIGASLAPILRDSLTRLLIGFLRAHDLLVVRQVVLDETATELLAALLPVSEAPPGEFEESRAQEISRWRGVLGPEVLDALRVEAGVLGASLAGLALQRVGMVPATALELLEALCWAAAAGGTVPQPASRYTQQPLLPEVARSVRRLLGHPDPKPLEMALEPLVAAVSDDMDVLAQLAKVALGLPA